LLDFDVLHLQFFAGNNLERKAALCADKTKGLFRVIHPVANDALDEHGHHLNLEMSTFRQRSATGNVKGEVQGFAGDGSEFPDPYLDQLNGSRIQIASPRITNDCSACHNLLTMDDPNPKLLTDLGMRAGN
jgi:hypothetical protein